MAKKKAMDLSIGSTDYVALEDSKFSTSSDDNSRFEKYEKTTPTTFTLSLTDVALLKAVAFARAREKGGKASSSAVLQDLLKEHRASLYKQADHYVLMQSLMQMTKETVSERDLEEMFFGGAA
jgi:hypothetical protein